MSRAELRGTRDLGASESGAILVVAVFMAVFLSATLLYVVGIAEAVLLRERLQDASDAVALSAASIHARGMNLVVLLAVLVALRLVEMLAIFATLLLVAAAFLGAEGALAAVPAVQDVRAGARQAQAALDGPVHACLRALHAAAGVVRDAVPALAEAEAIAMTVPAHRPPADVGFVVLPALALPLADDRFETLCERAGDDVGKVASLPLAPLPLPGSVRDALGDAVAELSSGASRWFCGATGSRRPALTREITRVLPTLAARARCEALSGKDDRVALARACEEAERWEAASMPDAAGECQSSCQPGGPFEERGLKAREQCDPRTREGLRGFVWQERTVQIELRRRGGAWLPSGRRSELPPRLVTGGEQSSDRPCGGAGARYSPDYDAAPHVPAGSGVVAPVCVSPWSSPRGAGDVATIERTEVMAMFGCRVTETVEIGGGSDRGELGRDGGRGDEVPFRMASGVARGGDELELRAAAFHLGPTGFAEAVMGVATWGHRAAVPLWAAPVGVGLAQAEYAFDGAGAPEEWMWSRRWASGLHRLRPPRSTARPLEWSEACRAAGVGAGPCSAFGALDGLLAASSH